MHPLNTLRPRICSSFGSVSKVISPRANADPPQRENAESPILVMPLGSVREVSRLQLSKAEAPIHVSV